MCIRPVITSCALLANSLNGLLFPSPTESSRIKSSRHCARAITRCQASCPGTGWPWVVAYRPQLTQFCKADDMNMQVRQGRGRVSKSRGASMP
jgi:hypothetical protein